MKKSINNDEYYQLIALQTLGQRKLAELDDIVSSTADIIGDNDSYRDWSNDLIWNHGNIRIADFLRMQGIEVIKDK